MDLRYGWQSHTQIMKMPMNDGGKAEEEASRGVCLCAGSKVQLKFK